MTGWFRLPFHRARVALELYDAQALLEPKSTKSTGQLPNTPGSGYASLPCEWEAAGQR